ncbi:hypothetical protein HMPREF9554_02920 [Treponema phagedenis F0421]|nr:hypothetical protein HMPREF9554_02920 [Treponema phagedenis F0421]
MGYCIKIQKHCIILQEVIMDFIHQKNRIYATDSEGKTIAEVTFPDISEREVMIDHTFVDSSLRGQGIADKLIREVIAVATKQNKKIEPVCSYAKTWFENNPDYKNICTE